ncbi:MAG TPA: hypothetical protein PK228_05655 [Saprospiraceae bacterium]|nr:hypothetical protein [Saprospiraceae bacterium]
MDLLKTKIYLDKLHREFARLSKDPENIVRIDVDIMASYVRELYDALLSEEVETPKHEPVAPAPRKSTPRPHVVETPMEFVPPPTPPPPPPPQEPVPAPAPVFDIPAPLPVAEEEKPTPPPIAPAKPHQHHATHHHLTDAEMLFEEKQVKELSEKLAEQPIADLKKAIALNDRLLLTRELFAGDGQVFEATLHALNNFTHFNEAKGYLLEHCVTRYLWLDKKRTEEAKKFVKLVRRRYKQQ